MKEILKQLFGEAVTDDALKQFNAELGKKFVAKTDYNTKLEVIKSLTQGGRFCCVVLIKWRFVEGLD